MTDINDYEILYLIQDGNMDYVKVLYDKYFGVIQNICNYYLKMYCFLDSDDVYQEAFLGFYYSVCNYKFSKNASFYSYVILCLKSNLSAYVRRFCNNKNCLLNYSVSFYYEIGNGLYLEDVLASDDDVYFQLLVDDFFLELIAFKNSLPIVEAEIFELRVNGFKYFEISSLLELKITRVNYYMRKIRKKMLNIRDVCCVF